MTVPTESPNSNHDLKNIFFFAIPAWGHCKPIVALAYRILESRPNVVVTLFTFSMIYPKLLSELDKIPVGVEGQKEDIKKRFNVIDVCGMIPNPLVPAQSFVPAFETLWKGEPLKCLSSGKEFTGLPKPSVAVVDPFAGYAMEAIREITLPYPNGPIKVVAWMTAAIGPCIRLLGPKELGGVGLSGRLSVKTIRYATEAELWPQMGAYSAQITGEVISIPGVPTMYDHEYSPQEIPINGSILEEIGRIYVPQCEGVFAVTVSCYEEAAMETVENWLRPLGSVLYPVGPLSLSNSADDTLLKPEEGSPKALAIEFLDMMKEKCGEKSVIYVSFGSMFWPLDENKMWAVIEEILASGTPLILAHPSPFMKPIDDEKLQFLREHPLAIEFEWAPQETILMHPATGWFISHGGWNSTQEAFVYRVPQIFWPFAADQPYNAGVICQFHEAGFELINVRTGEHGTKPLHRFKDLPKSEQPTFTVDALREEVRGLLVKLKGEEGLKRRKNFERLGAAFLKGWDQDGEARRSMEKFLKKYVD